MPHTLKRDGLLSVFNAVVLTPCRFDLDPRHQYWFDSLTKLGLNVLKVEVIDSIDELEVSRSCRLTENLLSLRSNRRLNNADMQRMCRSDIAPAVTPVGKFLKSRLSRLLHAVTEEVLVDLQPCVVVANDLLGVILADTLWGSSKTKVIYDAQEVFTDSYDVLPSPKLNNKERNGWIKMETAMCLSADLVVTVSTGIADLYMSRHAVNCETLPNFVPVAYQTDLSEIAPVEPVKFVMIGRADPFRGLENLVKSWDFPSEAASLDLIMPNTSQRKVLERLSANVKRKHDAPKFCLPVRPDQIVEVLADYDVGIIPYDYPYPLSHASPNKFGEYLASGLAILTHNQPFIQQQVELHQIGQVFSWDIEKDFEQKVLTLLNPEILKRAAANSKAAFATHLNWESAGLQVWNFISKIVAGCPAGAATDMLNLSKFEVTQKSTKFEQFKWLFHRKSLQYVQAFVSFFKLFG